MPQGPAARPMMCRAQWRQSGPRDGVSLAHPAGRSRISTDKPGARLPVRRLPVRGARDEGAVRSDAGTVTVSVGDRWGFRRHPRPGGRGTRGRRQAARRSARARRGSDPPRDRRPSGRCGSRRIRIVARRHSFGADARQEGRRCAGGEEARTGHDDRRRRQ